MTREEMFTNLYLLRDMSDKSSRMSIALDMAINELKAIENIKAEIKEVQSFAFRTGDEYEGLRMALEIIDEHIEKEKE